MRPLAVLAVLLLLVAAAASAQPGPPPQGGALQVAADGELEVLDGNASVQLSIINRGPADRIHLWIDEAPDGWNATLDPDQLAVGARSIGAVLLNATGNGTEGVLAVHWRSEAGRAGTVEVALVRGAGNETGRGNATGGPPAGRPADPVATFCQDNPDDRRCREIREQQRQRDCGEDGCPPPSPQACLEFRDAEARDCCARVDGDHPDLARHCAALEAAADAVVQRRHIGFEPLADGFANYTVDGQLILERLRYLPEGAPNVDVQPQNQRIEWSYGDEGRLVVHDNPTGLLRAHVAGHLVLRFPAGTTAVPEGDAWRIVGDGWTALAHGPDASFNDGAFYATGSFGIHLRPHGAPVPLEPLAAPAAPERQQMRDGVERATERGHVGAEVVVRKEALPADQAQVYTYDDVEVSVEMPKGSVATPADPIRVEFAADLHEGRTIVLDLDPALLQGELELRYFTVKYDAGVRHEVEVAFVEADSLEDVLDPTGHGIQPKYWVVRDAHGVHVLVSVPSWSIHAVTVASVLDVVLQPSVLVGVAAGAAGAGAAALALFWPRRREEEAI